MSFELIVLTQEQYKEWDVFVTNQENRSPYVRSEWFRLIHAYTGTPVHVLYQRQKNSINSALLFCPISFFYKKKIVGVPFSSTSCLVGDKKSFPSLMGELIQVSRKNNIRHIELRLGGELLPSNAEYNINTSLTCSQVELHDPDLVYKNFSTDHKRGIKQAIKRGVRIIKASLPVHWIEFQKLMTQSNRSKGIPDYGSRFYQLLQKFWPDKDLVLFLAKYEDRIISGMLFLRNGDHVSYKLGGSDMRYLETRPNNLLFWEAFKYFLSEGVKACDLGASFNNQPGLIRFKKNFGAIQYPAYIATYPLSCSYPSLINYGEESWKKKCWKILPEFATTKLGAYLRKWYC